MKLLRQVNDKFGLELTIRDLYMHSSISTLAKLIDSIMMGSGETDNSTIDLHIDLKREVKKYDCMMYRYAIRKVYIE